METIIYFFKDTLNGTIYYIVSTISFILIIICIKLLFIHNRKTKELDDKFREEHVVLVNNIGEKEVIDIAPVKVINNTILDKNESIINSNNINNSIKNDKKVVMINPNEVANVASQMNLIGVKSSQKKEIENNNSNDGVNINNDLNTGTNNNNSDMI